MAHERPGAAPAGVRRRALCLAFAVLACGGCASMSSQVRVQQAEAGAAHCSRFDWLPAASEATSLTEQRVRTAALSELQAKGYTQSSEQPDCKITYILSLSERPAPKPRVGVGAGGGSRGVGGGIGVSLPVGRKDQNVGTFTLDIIDVASNAQVWSGSLEKSFQSKELSVEEAQAVVRTILAEFPDRGSPEPSTPDETARSR